MKIYLLLFLLISSAISSEYNLKVSKINDNLYCFFGKNDIPTKENKGNMVNSCYIDGGDGLIVIDTGPTYIYAKEAHDIVTKITKKSVKAVVNTHFHDDHIGGNQFFREKNIPIYAHKAFVEAYEKIPDRFDRMKSVLDEKTYKGTKVALPDHYIEQNTTIKTKNGDIILFRPSEKAHTSADIVAWMPNQKIALVGDLVHTGMIIPIRDGNINGWIRAVTELEKLDAKIVVGGHGNSTDKKGVTFMREYLANLKNGVKTAMDQGVDLMDITKKVDMSKYDNIPHNKDTGAKNIIAVFQQLEMEE